MKLILSRFDPIKKNIIIYSIPNQNVSDEIQTNLTNIYDRYEDIDIGDEKIHYDFGPYLSILFNVKSAWYSDIYETLILTLYFEEHENIHFFEKILLDTVSELEKILELTKVLYINNPHADSNAFATLGKIIKILSNCFFEVNKLHSIHNLGLGEILMLGCKGGGKTSIVDYLIHGKFIPQRAPTLAPQVYKLFYNQLDFRVLDVCCNNHIRHIFEENSIEINKIPQAIVYVFDESLSEDDKLKNVEEFKDWIDFFKSEFSESIFEKIPILLLNNKADLNPLYNEQKVEDLFRTITKGLNVKIDSVSAKTGKGLSDNFSWLVKRLRITL